MCRVPACSSTTSSKCHQNSESCSFYLLELSANDDLKGLKQAVEERGVPVTECASWYCRQLGSNKMASVERSPIMIAALFGSMEVLHYLLDHLVAHGGDINSVCGADKVSVLHCAMAGGTRNMPDVVQLLLRYGADPTLVPELYDADSKLLLRPCQIAAPEKALLGKCMTPPLAPDVSDWKTILPDSVSDTSFEDLEESMRSLQDSSAGGSSHFSSSATWSPKSTGSLASENHDGPHDRTFDVLSSDVKSSIYSTDEFRMYSFKIRPCSRAYSHDWTECPFAHPGENARRRDPRRFHYSCVPCPDFRKGACRHGDACEYAHGVFESWLHPAQYRTRLCKDLTSCTRKVCFFAHTKEEVRPLYVSSECGVSACPSPCASPSSVKPSPFLPGGMNLSHSLPSSDKLVGSTWTQPGLPTLRLPEGVAHHSKLRASLSARDMALDGQSMRDLVSLSAQARINAAVVAASNSPAMNSPVRERKLQSFGSNLGPAANFEDVMYSAVSPRSPLQMGMQSSPRMTSKFHDSGTGNGALEELIAAMSSPRHSVHGRNLQGEYDHAWGHMGTPVSATQLGSSSLSGNMGSTFAHAERADVSATQLGSSSLSGNMGSTFALAERAEVGFPQKRRMESSACLSPARREDQTWLDWGSPTGKPEWGVSGDDLTRFRKSYSCKA